jgi:hypothetical protein
VLLVCRSELLVGRPMREIGRLNWLRFWPNFLLRRRKDWLACVLYLAILIFYTVNWYTVGHILLHRSWKVISYESILEVLMLMWEISRLDDDDDDVQCM